MAEILEAKERIEDLLFIAKHLIEILEQENAALVEGRNSVVGDLVDQKTKLSRAYEIRVLGMDQPDQDYSKVEPALIEELKTLSSRLQELVVINERELKINIEVGKRYMDVVAESVKAATPNAGTYGAQGTSEREEHNRKSKTASFAIDENL